jgi:anti-anti-sigma regulatory factor
MRRSWEGGAEQAAGAEPAVQWPREACALVDVAEWLRAHGSYGFMDGVSWLASKGADFLILDCSGLDSGGNLVVGGFLSAMRRTRARGGNVILAGLQEGTTRRLETLGIRPYLLSVDTVEEALAHIDANPVLPRPVAPPAASDRPAPRELSLLDWEILHRVGSMQDILEWFSRPKTYREAASQLDAMLPAWSPFKRQVALRCMSLLARYGDFVELYVKDRPDLGREAKAGGKAGLEVDRGADLVTEVVGSFLRYQEESEGIPTIAPDS